MAINIMRKLVRVVEEFNNEDEKLHKEYILNISTEKILEVLDDLVLNEDDYPNEIYDPYDLTISQIKRLQPFIEEPINENFKLYSYQLGCYEE
jgi:type IV secretory pathway component VirB8